VNSGLLTTKFICLISTHPRSLPVLCRPMRLHLGHVTLLGEEFNNLNCLPSLTYGAAPGRLTLGSVQCPKFLVFFFVSGTLHRHISELPWPITVKLSHMNGRMGI